MALLECHALSKHFGGLKAVDGVTFAVEQGQIFSLIGPNGAGKTTIFNLLTGFIKSTNGSASFQGVELQGKEPHHIAKLGLTRTYQHTSVFPGLTVFENARIGCHRNLKGNAISALLRSRTWERDEAFSIETANKTLDFLGLSDEVDVLASNLPYGKLRLVEIAVALCLEPKLLLLDEPASGMNPDEALRVMDLIGRIRDRGITVLLVEHNMQVVMGISDHIFVMDHGCEIASGAPEIVSQNELVIEAYLGGGFSNAKSGAG